MRQFVQSLLAFVSLYLPFEHSEHSDDPIIGVDRNLPTAQSIQSQLPAVRYVPARQGPGVGATVAGVGATVGAKVGGGARVEHQHALLFARHAKQPLAEI